MPTHSRDDFSLAIKRALSHRVGLLCSNPGCRTLTAGPQSDPSKVSNIGVAAHITGASPGGPRFDEAMTQSQRKSAVNGIRLCQNCAHLVDHDLEKYSMQVLFAWKSGAEAEAKTRIGKTDSKVAKHSIEGELAALKREHKLRDDLHRDLLKSREERLVLPRVTNRSSKFSHSEVIIRRIGDRTYPNTDDGVGISGWFKLEVLDFYHGGLECILDLQHILEDSQSGTWCLITYEQSELSIPKRLLQGQVFVTGKIPWRNILYYDMAGDEYYPQPHLYCEYANDGQPYEGIGYFKIDETYKREVELQPENRMELDSFLKLAGQMALHE